jgi:hypothetical protein
MNFCRSSAGRPRAANGRATHEPSLSENQIPEAKPFPARDLTVCWSSNLVLGARDQSPLVTTR